VNFCSAFHPFLVQIKDHRIEGEVNRRVEERIFEKDKGI
jgi:hypothetical protein